MQGRRTLPRPKGAKPTRLGTCKCGLGLHNFYMKRLDSAGFFIAQPMLMRRASEAERAPALTANFCKNYQKSNKNHFLKMS